MRSCSPKRWRGFLPQSREEAGCRDRSRGVGSWIALASLVAALALPQAAEAAIPSALGVTCAEQGNGVRFCGSDAPRSTAPAFDGVPIDVNVAFPPAPASGTDGSYPLMMLFHGYGGGKIGLDGMQRWLDRGYATFSMTDRGFRESCGSAESQAAAGGACANGYVRLIDNRYEVRDAQEFAGQLADAGLIDPQRIGSIGGSYGGGMSMALGALRNRKVMPDSSLVPWTSPSGTPMQIAAAAPNIPWTDLAYSLAPNGSTLDYVADAPYEGRLGVQKQSYVNTLYLGGLAAPGFYAPAGSDPSADIAAWRARLEAGEPYGADVQAIVDELTEHHSSYYIDDSIAPAPMLMSSGFTDDLFPPTETIRYYNRTRTEYPDADLALFFGDFGHPRAQNKSDVTSALVAAENAWMDFYVKGTGKEPAQNVTAYTETCPGTAASGGPYRARDWARMANGEVRYAVEAGEDDRPRRGQPRGGGEVQPVRRQRLHDRRRRRSAGDGDLPARPRSRRWLHDARLGDRDRQVHPAGQHLAGRGPAARRRPRRSGDAGRPRALAAADRRADEAGLPALPERLDVRRGSRAEARAVARRLQPRSARRLRARPRTTSGR